MAFPRTVVSTSITLPWLPGALKAVGQAGGVQVRATKAAGWTWKETFPLLGAHDPDHMALIAHVEYMHNRGAIDTITHPLVPGSGRDPNGLGTGGVTVNGGSQTGGSLSTAGWPNNTSNVARAGDVIKIAGDNGVYRVRADANSNGTGIATLEIVPHLRISPSNGAAVTTSGVEYRVIVLARSQFESSRAPTWFGGFEVTFTEMF